MAHLHALPIGHAFEGYRIERVLGAGGFGITYEATEAMIGRAVAIKEFLPSSIAGRAIDSLAVHPIVEAEAEMFRWGLKRFRNEARTLVSFHHANIVQVYRYFEANGTAYLVMAYEAGETLAARLKSARTLPEAEIRAFLGPLLSGVAEVHKAGFLHRDIKPANIVIRGGGVPVLIDFGAARQALGAKSQSAHAIVSPGYAPFEQYTNSTEQGPWTDLYSLGATLYCCVTGTRPVEATDRVAGAEMRPASEIARGRYDAAFLAAIDRALGVYPEDRPRNVAEWRMLFEPAAAESDSTLAPAPIEPATVPPAPLEAPKGPRLNRRAMFIGLIAGAATVMSAGGYAVVRDVLDDERKRAEELEKRLRQQQADDAAAAEKAARETAARQRAEAAAQKGREAQSRGQAAARLALAAKQQALTAADCARKAAARARNGDGEHYAGLLKNGSRYEGQLNTRTNFPEGCGIVTQTEGSRYEGQFSNTNWNGYGVSVSKDGVYYEGSYKNGQPDGPGVLRLKDGSEAWMSMVRNALTGPGLWIAPNGNRYEGDLVAGRWQGHGVLRFGNGFVHEGEFVNGNMTGLGVRTDAAGKKQHGRWEQGQFKGLE